MSGIVQFLTARLDDREQWARAADHAVGTKYDPITLSAGETVSIPLAELYRNARPERVLAEVAAKRRIVELHTTGSYRTYQCSNGDHIQEWQCERAKEPYTEDRYCEVCGGSECAELPLLAALYEQHPDYNPVWRVE